MSTTGPKRRMIATIAAALLLGGPATTAHAHGADAGTADIRLGDDTAYVVVWPTSETFAAFDDDGDGRIRRRETRAHRREMLADFLRHFSLRDQAGRPGTLVFEDLSTPGRADLDVGAEHLRVTLRYRWEATPDSLVLRSTLGGSRPLHVRTARVVPAATTQERRLLAPPEETVFDREHVEQTILAPLP